jgi:hypothetical protein
LAGRLLAGLQVILLVLLQLLLLVLGLLPQQSLDPQVKQKPLENLR